MEVVSSFTLKVELVKGVSKKGTEYLAARVGDALIFDNKLVTLLTVKYMSEVEKES